MPSSQKIKAPEALLRMLERYELNTILDYKNAIKEIVQGIALLGLWRGKFFEKAAFYGGTALRILYELDRFSENLDFTLLKPDQNFNIEQYEKTVREELQSFGFSAEVKRKKKTIDTTIESAFIKMNTIEHLLFIGLPKGFDKSTHPDEVIKIRFEVDTAPPPDCGTTENRLLLLPHPFSVKTLRLEDLFAGKVHATLCREWKGRVKGRDWYDLVWFVSRDIPLNLYYLEQRMRQSGYWPKKGKMTRDDLVELFDAKIKKLDIKAAKKDIINFLRDASPLELWSKDFFREISQRIRLLD